MKFEVSPICKGKRYCQICRRQNANGNAFRIQLTRLFELNGNTNFECTSGLPWLPDQVSQEALNSFMSLVDELIIFNSRNMPAPIMITGEVINKLLTQQYAIRDMFPKDSAPVKAIDWAIGELSNPRGCAGCRRGKVMRGFVDALQKCSNDEKRKLLALAQVEVN